LPVKLTAEGTHVSFDNHLYLIAGVELDRGEFADIVIHDRQTQTLVAVEAKLYSDWSFNKDVVANAARLRTLYQALGDTRIIACLLVAKAKWTRVVRMQKHPLSNFQRLKEVTGQPPIVLLWEQILDLCDDARVKAYLQWRLAVPLKWAGYKIVDGAFQAVHTPS
jgi:hypothetical protein